MGVRLVALSCFLLCALQAQVPPPMFSPWYGEAMLAVQDFEESDAVRLEQRLAANPDDPVARLQLMAYHSRADRAGRAEDFAKRVRHALWLIEHHPDSEILRSPVSGFQRGALGPADYRRAVALWEAAAKARPRDAAVQWNAASFFRSLDPDLYLRYLEATAAVDPDHPYAIRPLAHLYALSILEGGPSAAHAQAALDASRNVWTLGNAANMFQSQYNLSLQRGAPNARAAELAERYFERALALDPKLDRNAVLPRLQPEARPPQDLSASFQAAERDIRRLPVSAFPELPAAVADVLRARNCAVPQTAPGGAPQNVIRGEFFTKGETGWAALCSVNGSTSLLVFRHDRDANPDAVAVSEDRAYLQDMGRGEIGYSHQISPASRKFIVSHYRAYGGPEPPAIDHQGIDDAFLEKASVIWYFHRGKWLQLQGAD